MAKPKSTVNIVVHQDFFNKIFEPSRKDLARKIGIDNISQSKFTHFLSKEMKPMNFKIDPNQFKLKRGRFRL